MIFYGWISTSFLVAMIILTVLAALVRDRKIHIGVVVLALAWAGTVLTDYVLGRPIVIVAELAANLLVAYVFWQLHLGNEGDKSGPIWPVPIIIAELGIFTSHITSITLGFSYYILLVNLLFAFELLFLIGVCVLKIFQRFSLISSGKPRTDPDD